MKKILLWTALVSVCALMLIFPNDAIESGRRALKLCADTVVPSLFPFFVCSGLLIYSGFCQTLSTLAKPVMRPLFNVNENGSGAFILGIISGYPLGAVTACQLYESGYLSKYETERLLSFCNNSGPLFILGSVGICMYQNSKIGTLLYIAHLVSALTVGVIFRFYKRNKHTAPQKNINHSQKDVSQIFSAVMQNSLNSIITICGSVVFFSVVSQLVLLRLPLDGVSRSILSGIMEMTGGVKEISSLSVSIFSKLLLSSAIVGFAGFCVHLQVVCAVARYNLSLFPYFAGKILHAVLSAAYLYLMLKIFPTATPVFAQKGDLTSLGFCIASAFTCISVIFFLLLTLLTPRKKAVF